MVSSIVGIGLVGLGDISRKRYIPQILNSKHARLVAVCSQHESTFDCLKPDLRCERWYSDFHELVVQSDVDAVIIASPHPTHAAVAVAALSANKHVLIEKPLVTRLPDALAIAEAAKKSSAVVMALPWDQAPVDKLIHSVLRRGVLGNVVSVRLVNGGTGPLYRKGTHDPDWAFKKRAGGGVLLGHGVYGLARIARIVGPATSVKAEMALLQPQRRSAAADAVITMENEDYCAMSLEVGTKQDITFECGWTYAGPSDTLTITGTNGVLTSVGRSAIFVQGHNQLEHAAALGDLKFSFDDANKLAVVRGSDVMAPGQTPTIVDDFADCIVTERAPTANLEQAVHITEQMMVAYESSAAGGVRMPLTSTFAANSELPSELFKIGDLDTSHFAASGRFRERDASGGAATTNGQHQPVADGSVLRQQFAREHQMVLRSVFTTEECEDILAWADFREGRLRNCFGDPDSHLILSRMNAKLAEIFGRNYKHIQTAMHYSSDTSANTHNVHIDFPQRFFTYNPEDNLQIWILLRARDLKPDDELLCLWTGFRPDASKKFDRKDVSKLQKHQIKGLTVGDVLVFSSWLPHSSGSIDHPYERYAFKVHYYSDQAVTDDDYLRQNLRLALRVSAMAHNGTGPAMFAAEKLLGGWSRALVKYPLALFRSRQSPNKEY
jgi:predicted dehydrogenase